MRSFCLSVSSQLATILRPTCWCLAARTLGLSREGSPRFLPALTPRAGTLYARERALKVRVIVAVLHQGAHSCHSAQPIRHQNSRWPIPVRAEAMGAAVPAGVVRAGGVRARTRWVGEWTTMAAVLCRAARHAREMAPEDVHGCGAVGDVRICRPDPLGQ